ncbi:hypothetical protein Ari01nite_23570 [Paractinoplanes rishiriensis]|uniref:Uncharacterized protein n=1 Tax=Paractinoplanes rishiriensis TaxID=1050105 RepID=A0A919JWR8_9ACTN|nr:hypothetical protein Ari01nite_23570 [Actinoplanes rishiriensis]
MRRRLTSGRSTLRRPPRLLAGCHRESGSGVTNWILDIVRRRVADVRLESGCDVDYDVPDQVEHSRPSYAELELAALLRRPAERLLGDRSVTGPHAYRLPGDRGAGDDAGAGTR